MKVLTREALTEAIRKSKATTVTAVWRYMGNQAKISGSQAKMIRQLVPDHAELFKANLNGTNVAGEKTPVAPAEAVVVAPAKKSYYIPKAKGAGGFRAGSCLELLFKEGSKEFLTRDELVARVAKIKNKSEHLVLFDFRTTMPYPHHPNNRGRASVIEKDGKIKVVVPA